jgi:hypothetical protein
MSDAEEEEREEYLPLADVDRIRPLLNEFKSATRGARKNVIRKALTAVMAARDISHLRPLAQGKTIARVKEVRAKCSLIDDPSTDLMLLNSKSKLGSTITDVTASRKILSNICGAGIFDRWWAYSIRKRSNSFVGSTPMRSQEIRRI